MQPEKLSNHDSYKADPKTIQSKTGNVIHLGWWLFISGLNDKAPIDAQVMLVCLYYYCDSIIHTEMKLFKYVSVCFGENTHIQKKRSKTFLIKHKAVSKVRSLQLTWFWQDWNEIKSGPVVPLCKHLRF